MSLTGLIIGLSVGAVWLVGCFLLISRIGIKKHRITMCVIAVIIFIVCGGIFCGTWIVANKAKNVIGNNAELVDKYVKERHGDVKLVRSGVDAADVQQAVNDLEAIVPRSVTEFGLSGVILENVYKEGLRFGFNFIRTKPDLIVKFAKDGKITSSTIIEAVEDQLNYRIERFVFWEILINAAILAVFLCICIIMSARKNRETVVFGKTE